MNVLLAGTVGSTAYGLDHEGSDIDTLGMFAAPTRAFHGLQPPQQTHVTTDPDSTYHEAAKGVRLMLASNPTASELLWLERYTELTELGEELIALRHCFLTRGGVRNAYLGYAYDQFEKLGPLKISTVNVPRRKKHARHLVRLLVQGTELHRTGNLNIRLENPEKVRAMGEAVFRDPAGGRQLLDRAKKIFDEPSALAEHTDPDPVEAWLHRVRDHYYQRPT